MDRPRREVVALGSGLVVATGLALAGLSGCGNTAPSPIPKHNHVPTGFDVPGVGFALGDEMQGLSAPQIRTRLLEAKGTGADTVRYDADWWYVDTHDDGMDNIKNVATVAAQLGMQSMVTITGVPPQNRLEAYNQAQNDPPSNIDDMGNFAKAVVSMLAELSVMYEYRNETNLYYDPERYAREINRMYKFIYAGNKLAQLSVCGLAPNQNFNANSLSPGTFLDLALQHGMTNFHSIGDHATCNPAEPGDPYSWSGFTQLVGPSALPSELSVADVVQARHMSGVPINVSEYAVSTFGNGPRETEVDDGILATWANNPANGYASEAFQARSIKEAMLWDYQASGLNVLKFLVYTDRDLASMKPPYVGSRAAQAQTTSPPYPIAFNYNGVFTFEGEPKLIVADGTYQRSAAQFLEMAAARAQHFAH